MSRPVRRCGRPKRFDDSDSDEPLLKSTKNALTSSLKRKSVTFMDDDYMSGDETGPPQAKKAKSLTPKLLKHRIAIFTGQHKTAGEEEEEYPEDYDSDTSSLLLKTNKSFTEVQTRPTMNIKPGPKSMKLKYHLMSNEDYTAEDEEAKIDLQLEAEEDLEHDVESDLDDEETEEQLEGMLSEYRVLFNNPVVDMTKGNLMVNKNYSVNQTFRIEENGIVPTDKVTKKKVKECRDCRQYKEELDHYEEMIKLKDCELEQIMQTITDSRQGGQKLSDSLTENIEKRVTYHKMFIDTENKLRSAMASKDKWEALYNREVEKNRDLELRCETLERKLKIEQRRTAEKRANYVEISANKYSELIDIKNNHVKNCHKLKEQIEMLNQENTTTLKAFQRSEVEHKNKYLKMRKHYLLLLEHYIHQDSRLSKRKELLNRKMLLYRDVGSREQIVRDSAQYLNPTQLAFLEGQLSTERTFVGKDGSMPRKYKELLLAIYQTSVIAYRTLRSFNFNMPHVLSMQQLSQSEVCNTSEEQYAILGEKSEPVTADHRTLRALCSDEEDEEMADLLDASAAQQQDQCNLISDEEAEDGVDGDYVSNPQPDEDFNEEEDEEGGADYLSDDEPDSKKSTGENGTIDALDQQEYQNDLQRQLDHQITSEFTAEPQFESMDAQLTSGIIEQHVVHEASNVDQLVTSMNSMQNQIQISGLNPNASEHLLVKSSDGSVVEVVAGTEVLQSSNIISAVDVPEGAVVVTTNTPAISTASPKVSLAVNSAETGLAERGEDMPLL